MHIKLTGKTCRAMEGLVEEGKEVLDNSGQGAVIDAALIGAAQRVEHYEIAAYGVARAMAETLSRRTSPTCFSRRSTRKAPPIVS